MALLDARAARCDIRCQYATALTVSFGAGVDLTALDLQAWVQVEPFTTYDVDDAVFSGTVSGTGSVGSPWVVTFTGGQTATEFADDAWIVFYDAETDVPLVVGRFMPSLLPTADDSVSVSVSIEPVEVAVTVATVTGAFDAAGAAAAAQAFAIQRGNHTGSQAISTVSGLQTALDGKETAGAASSAVTAHNSSGSAHADIRTLLDGKAAAGYTPALSGIVGTYLILGTEAVDGTATEMTLYQAVATAVNDSTSLPDGLSVVGTFPLGDGSPGANWNFVFNQIGEPAIVVIVGDNAGVYRLTPGALDEPWEELPSPVGTFAGFYISDAARLLLARTAYGWITLDPVENITSVELPYLSGSAWHTAQDAIEALESDDLCLLLDGTSDGWSTPNLGDTVDGIDIRMKFLLRRPTNHGVQKYMELLTQSNPGNTGGDNWELAGQWSDGTEGGVPDVLELFWEHTELGAPGETARFHDVGLRAGEWATVRVTVDTANSTTSFYREVAYDGDDTAGGREWRLVKAWTYDEAGSMDTGVTTDWEIGLRALGQVAWLEVCEFGAGTLLVDLKPSHMLSAGVGATSVTDGEGNVWTAGGSCEVGYVNPLGARLAAIEAAL